MRASGTAGGGGRGAGTVWRLLRLFGALACVFAMWRLAAGHGQRSPVVEAVVTCGWGLSLLPVHVTARRPRVTALRKSRQPAPDFAAPDRPTAAAHGRDPSGPTWQRGHQ